MNRLQTTTIGSVAAIAGMAQAQPSFQTVGVLSGGNPVSHALGVSSDGQVVVGYSTASLAGIAGFRWSNGSGLEQIPALPNTNEYVPYATSPSGSIVTGTHGSGGGPVGFVWSSTLGTISIGDLPGGNRNSYLSTISSDFQGVGASSYAFSTTGAGLFRAIKWSPERGIETLPLPGATDLHFNSSARALLPDGRVFGQSASGAWLYSESDGSYEMLEGAEAMTRVSPDGTFFAGEASLGGARAAYWTREEGLTYLPLMDEHFFSNFRGMSDDGTVIVGTSVGQMGGEQVLWLDRGEPVRVIDFATDLGLDMDGWRIINVGSVSADGSTIVGTARHESWASGHVEGFVLTIPAPGAGAVMLAAGAMAIRRRKR